MIKVAVCGAGGKMGREAVRTICEDAETELVAAVDVVGEGEDIGSLVLGRDLGVVISSSLEEALSMTGPGVVVDFTNPMVVMDNIRACLQHKVPPVVGTTGLTEVDFKEIRELSRNHETAAVIVPNFALGAVLMMKFAQIASRFFKSVEVVELHHDGKVDAPSGTALKTAELMAENIKSKAPSRKDEIEKVSGSRGGCVDGIRVHSVRLPGLVAHQEVILGGEGQTLTIRHDSLDRRSFMPGLLLAVKKAPYLKEMVYGLEHLMDLD